MQNNEFYPLYDSWYMEDDEDPYLESYEKAKKYIINYLRDDVYFAVVIKK